MTETDDALAIRRHLEDREGLMFTSRALSVSEMASALAHELNQPIGTVINVLLGIKARLAASPSASLDGTASASLASGVALALDQALFASAIISRIRNYTHSRQPKGDTLDLSRVVHESLALLDWEVRRDNVPVQLEITEEPCHVVGDKVMLQQTLVNLLRNALEAMRDASPERRCLQLRLAIHRQGREARLAIRDTGCGLPAGAEQRLFVPFQSTKPNGMGIGLNICRSFVELHQGRLWFTRNETDKLPCRGSTFHIALPVASPPALPASMA